ncbi:MAG TPA: DEAD/DEAH box helicase family protein [Polyangia bacterium]|nr:DEAD/DEAH box helicase family protein [Polyangia bacterium]
MRLTFDRGTLLLEDAPPGVEAADFPGFLWDERVGALRAPARLAYPLAAALRRREVPLSDAPRPKLVPPSSIRPVSLRPYQHAALLAWRRAGRRGVVVLPTGAGKTRVALAAIAQTRTPCLVLVPTRALLAQWVAALGDIYDGPIGRFGDGDRVLAPLTVATFAGAYRHMAAIGDRFGMLVVDEAHHFGTGAFDEALEMSIAPVRLGLTAMPPAPGPVATRLAALVGPPVFELGVADLAGRWLAPLRRVTLRLALDDEERREYDALVAVYREAVRAFMGSHLGASWEDFLREASRTDEGRRGIAAWRRAARLLSFPRCKREALATLLARHREQRTLVFVAHKDTAYQIAREHLIMPLTSEIGRDERQATLERFRTGELRALVSAQVLNEGIDVPEAEVGIVVAGRMGEREHVQRVGRLLRPGPGKQALLYELVVAQSGEVRQAEKRSAGLAARRRPAA